MRKASEVEVLDIVNIRTNSTNGAHDVLNRTYIDEIGRRIRHYCNITEIPEELTSVWASMALHLVVHVQQSYQGGTVGAVSSIKEGDAVVTFAQNNKIISPALSHSMIDGIILNYKADLNPYRKLRW